jgi:hypothetical protein
MSGPGTELGQLIPAWLAKQSKGCGCSNRAAKMDKWGIDGCIKHRKTIINWLVFQKKLLPPVFHLLPDNALRAGAGVLVDRAIANAKIKAEHGPDVSDVPE